MKKILALAMTAVLALSIVGCTANTAPTEAPTTAAPATTAAAEGTEATAPEFTTVKEGVLTMATNAAFPPYEFVEGGEIIGIDAEIVEAIADKLGLGFEIEDMEFDSVIPSVKEGKADMGLAGITVTPERAEEVDFTASYAQGVQVVIVNEGSAITTVDDLFAEGASTLIGVQRNTTGDLYSTWDLEDAGLATVERYSRGADAVQSLITGKIDCVIIDNEPAKAFVAENEGLYILDTEYAVEDYAAAMNKENPELAAAVGEAMQELIDDGTIAGIIEKYIPTEG